MGAVGYMILLPAASTSSLGRFPADYLTTPNSAQKTGLSDRSHDTQTGHCRKPGTAALPGCATRLAGESARPASRGPARISTLRPSMRVHNVAQPVVPDRNSVSGPGSSRRCLAEGGRGRI